MGPATVKPALSGVIDSMSQTPKGWDRAGVSIFGRAHIKKIGPVAIKASSLQEHALRNGERKAHLENTNGPGQNRTGDLLRVRETS